MSTGDAELTQFRERRAQQQALAYTRFFSPVTREFVPALVRRAGPGNGVALDLGCGDGSLAAGLRERGYRTLALDRSPQLAATAARADGAGRTLVGDALGLPVASGVVDVVATAFVLPHLERLDVALEEVRRVLRPGGRLVLAGWRRAVDSPFTGLGTRLLHERAAPEHRAALDEAARRTAPGHLRERIVAAGFQGVREESLASVVRLDSAQDWWKGLVGASCGFGDLLRAQTPEVQQDTATAFQREAAGFASGDGGLAVPVGTLVMTARAG